MNDTEKMPTVPEPMAVKMVCGVCSQLYMLRAAAGIDQRKGAVDRAHA